MLKVFKSLILLFPLLCVSCSYFTTAPIPPSLSSGTVCLTPANPYAVVTPEGGVQRLSSKPPVLKKLPLSKEAE